MSLYIDFCKLADDFGSSEDVPVIYPSSETDPPSKGEWVELSWFPNQTVNIGMGNDGPFSEQGLGQLAACARMSTGAMKRAVDLANSIIEAFPKGTVIGRAYVYTPAYSSLADIEGDRAIIPVTIPWRT